MTLRRLPAYRGAQDYRKLPVQAIMSHEVFTLEKEETLHVALKRIALGHQRYHAYPVVASDGRLAGVLTRHELEENDPEKTVGELLEGQQLLSVTPDTSIRDAANRMIARDFQQVPVVSGTDPRKMLGWLTLNDIARQQNAAEN